MVWTCCEVEMYDSHLVQLLHSQVAVISICIKAATESLQSRYTMGANLFHHPSLQLLLPCCIPSAFSDCDCYFCSILVDYFALTS